MYSILFRLLFVAALLCDSLGFTACVNEQPRADSREASLPRHFVRRFTRRPPQPLADSREALPPRHAQLVRSRAYSHEAFAEEPQPLIEAVFRSTPSSHRIASSRPSRLLPTHGGKPTNHPSRWAKGESSNPLKHALLLSCRCHRWHFATVASPRLRYVIALRRLLC